MKLLLLLTLLLGSITFAQTASTRPTEMKIMSFNIRTATALGDAANHWNHRQDLFFETIHRFDPDLLGMQEVVQVQLDAATKALNGYDHIGVAREDGKQKGEYAPIFFKQERFEPVETGTWWLSPTPEKVASVGWDAALTRIASWVRLKDKSTNEVLFVVNTHFDHVGKVARHESARLLRDKMKDLKERIVLMGDFNCTDADDPVKAIVAGDILIDTYRKIHPESTDAEATFHGFNGTVEGKRIDFIFTKGFDILDAGIDRTREGKRTPSDHDAVTATVK